MSISPNPRVPDAAGDYLSDQEKRCRLAAWLSLIGEGGLAVSIEMPALWYPYPNPPGSCGCSTLSATRASGTGQLRCNGEERLAGREAALWLASESLTVEHDGEPLSRYEVWVEAATGELRSVARPRLFETSHRSRSPQRRLFELGSLGEGG